MRKEELREVVSIIKDIVKKLGEDHSLQFITKKIVAVVPIPYDLKGAVKGKVEFEDVTNPVLKIDSEDIPLKVLSLKPGVKAFVGFQDTLFDVFDVEVVEGDRMEDGGNPFLYYCMWDPKAYPTYVKYDDPVEITAIATGLWVLQNLNSDQVIIDFIGSREELAGIFRKIAPELERLKKFKIR